MLHVIKSVSASRLESFKSGASIFAAQPPKKRGITWVISIYGLAWRNLQHISWLPPVFSSFFHAFA